MTAYKNRAILYPFICLAVLALQVAFSWDIRDIRPQLGYVPTPPSAGFLKGMAMGDDQFIFRSMALMIQNSGDTFGRFSALKLYDFNKLQKWMTLLDGLDPVSDMMPSMASYYFSQTQNVKDVRYMVDYLYTHASRDVEKKWWWLIQAIYLANHKLEDSDLALKVALPLKNPKVPVLGQQMLAIVYEKRGELNQAYDMIVGIQESVDKIPERELRFMQYFVEERLGRMEDYEKKLEELHKPMGPDIYKEVPKPETLSPEHHDQQEAKPHV